MLNSVLLDMFQGGLKADSVKLYLGLFVGADKAWYQMLYDSVSQSPLDCSVRQSSYSWHPKPGYSDFDKL